MTEKQKTAIVTGSAGFIGFHLSKKLLEDGWRVVGIDCLSDYYAVSLKLDRERMLREYPAYRVIHEKIETPGLLAQIFQEEKPDTVVHLAAQAGVRFSIENPRSYFESNILGTFELLEAARLTPPRHLLMASTSSAYGANKKMPYRESDRADHQMSFYAATKKSTENMAHSYSHLFDLPITMFRFFTVYGPWGRPDMALFKFTKAILDGNKIDVFNGGKMKRDFTYIDDIIYSVCRLIDALPSYTKNAVIDVKQEMGQSPVAPFRIINIGNSNPEKLTDFIKAIENATGLKAIKNPMPMQAGDVPATWADTRFLESIIGKCPKTNMVEGVTKFVSWFRHYHKA